jgi:multiple antibiotic resistance protein
VKALRAFPGSIAFLIGGAVAAVVLWHVAGAYAQSPVVAPSSASAVGRAQLSYAMVFTAFMVMLGPLKLVGPFAKYTAGMEEPEARKVGTKAVFIACIGGFVAAVTGQKTLVSWGISTHALYLAAGLVLLLVALKTVLEQYEAPQETAGRVSFPNLAFAPLAFPTILTPHGIATFILILTVSKDQYRDAVIVGLFLIVMGLNWIVMWFARAIVRRGGAALAILGAVLGVLQVALAVQMIVTVLRLMRVMPDLVAVAS